MVNILLIAATEAEIAPLIKHISSSWEALERNLFQQNEVKLEIQVCGVGMLATAYWLTKKVTTYNYDLVIQAGVAGAYDKEISLGTVVWVKTEQLADLRVEDNEEYKDFFELGLIDANEHPFTNKELHNPYSSKTLMTSDLQEVTAITLNTTTGKQSTIEHMQKRYAAQVESMEGAGLHYVCLVENVKFLQIRSISNYVEPRNRGAWEIGIAITNVNKYLIKYFSDI